VDFVEKGYNSDITIQGSQYHVQTEDWGLANPYLVSRIYRNGAVVKSVKRSYEEVICQGPVGDRQAIRLALQDQHYKILDLLLSGQWQP
jgi:hypothetical protein